MPKTPVKWFTLRFNCEGEQFRERQLAHGLGLVLDDVSNHLKAGEPSGTVQDRNGVAIGRWLCHDRGETGDEVDTPSSTENRFTVYVNCDGTRFQDETTRLITLGIVVRKLKGQVHTGRWCGAIMTEDYVSTYGNWALKWTQPAG